MGSTVLYLDVGDKKVRTIDVKYDDLIILYRQFIEKFGKVPTTKECVYKNNLPQVRIVNRVLDENNVTYNDFLSQFGKYSHVRTNRKDKYDFYVQRFKDICEEQGKTISIDKLNNNKFGLPNIGWLIKNCPDKTVKTYADFIHWCDLEPAKHIWTKDEVASKLKELESKLKRPIMKSDISSKTIGFSLIVVNRLFGGLTKAKQELGLLKTLPLQPKPFEIYKESLTNIVMDYKKQTGLTYISWRDIESGKYGNGSYEHKSYMKSFKSAGVDLYAYIRSLGCMMGNSKFSYKYTFEDGERAESKMEYEVTTYLRSLGLEYNKDYFRSVKYKTFTNDKSRMDCDYVIQTHYGNLYLEVAGIIHNIYNDWRTHTYSSNRENEYRDKMVLKENILKESNIQYLFIFSNNMESEEYKTLIQKCLQNLTFKNIA